MTTTYKVTALGGQYIREGMRTADEDTLEWELRQVMAYLGYPDPAIEYIDGGEWYAYANHEVADSAAENPGVHPILVASPVEA